MCELCVLSSNNSLLKNAMKNAFYCIEIAKMVCVPKLPSCQVGNARQCKAMQKCSDSLQQSRKSRKNMSLHTPLDFFLFIKVLVNSTRYGRACTHLVRQPSFAQRMTGKSAFIDDDLRFMTKKKTFGPMCARVKRFAFG